MVEQWDRGDGLVKDVNSFSQQYFPWFLFMRSLLLSNEIFLNMLCFPTGVLFKVFPLPQMPFLHFHSIKWRLFFNASCVSFSLWPYHIFMRENRSHQHYSKNIASFQCLFNNEAYHQYVDSLISLIFHWSLRLCPLPYNLAVLLHSDAGLNCVSFLANVRQSNGMPSL